MTDTNATKPFRPQISVHYSEATRGVILDLQVRADGPVLRIPLSADEAVVLRGHLGRAIDDRDHLRADLDAIDDLPEADEPH
jgi:hypothetical protein